MTNENQSAELPWKTTAEEIDRPPAGVHLVHSSGVGELVKVCDDAELADENDSVSRGHVMARATAASVDQTETKCWFFLVVDDGQAVIEREEFLEIIGILNLGSLITFILLIFTGVLDTFVAVLLVAKDKIFPKLPYLYLYLWVGLWPIIPRIVEWYGGMDPEPMEAFELSVVAALAYGMHIYQKNNQ